MIVLRLNIVSIRKGFHIVLLDALSLSRKGRTALSTAMRLQGCHCGKNNNLAELGFQLLVQQVSCFVHGLQNRLLQ